MKKTTFMIACFFVSAQIQAISIENDRRIRTETYDKNRVFDIYTTVGRATLIQLENDESLNVSSSSVLGIGDADAWNLGVRGNNIVLKPAQKMPKTNIVVVTNKRTYSFELKPTPNKLLTTYILRFRYPDSEAAKLAEKNAADIKRLQLTNTAKAQPATLNTDYVWRGENELLKPTAAYDDGRFTRLVYDNTAELPTFYKVLPDNTEALINSNIDPQKKNTLVLHEVIHTIRARLGNDVIEITNKKYTPAKFNETGTSVYGAVRVEKDKHD